MPETIKGLEVTTLEDVLERVQGMSQPKYNFMLGDEPIKISRDEGLTGVRFTVPKHAIFDRLSDGTYTPKFENFKGAVGNEDRLAREQSAWEQAWHGASKAVIKTGAYALDATLGTAYGIINGISEGSWDAVWNNELSNSLDDFNTKLDNNLVNYYTDEEKQRGFLAAIPGFGATNFWFNDVGNGLAFVGGVILPEVAIGILSGGTTLGVGAGKIGFKLGGKALRETAEATAKSTAKSTMRRSLDTAKSISGYNNYKKGAAVMRKFHQGIYGKIGGDIVGTGLFLARSSNFEAGMEARHNYHDAIETFYRDFEDANGRPPSYDETTQFMKDAKVAANGVYAANLAILSVSNAVMFGKKFNIGVEVGKKAKNFGNRFVGLGVKHTPGGKSALRKVTRGQKILGNAYFVLGKPIVEGIYEEGFQGVAGTTMQNWLDAKYNPETESSYDLWASLTDAFAHQYTSPEGWKEMGIGMIIGFMGGGLQGQGFSGVGKNSRKQRQARMESEVEAMNKGRDHLSSELDRSTGMTNFGNLMKSKSDNMQSTYAENAVLNKEFIQSQERIKSKSEIIDDYNAVVDNMELSDSQIDLIGEDNVDAYKQSLKEEFNRNYKDYRFAKKAVAALGLDTQYSVQNKNRGARNTEGNLIEIQDALMQNIMIGRGALQGAKNVASQISDLTGIEGVFSILEHYNSLSADKKARVKTLKSKQKTLEKLRARSQKYANNLAGLQTGRQFKEGTNQARYLKANEEFVLTRQAISELESEIQTLTQALDKDIRAENLDLEAAVNIGEAQGIQDVIENIDKLNTYIDSLAKSGRTQDALLLNNLLEEYKSYSDAHNETVNNYHRMRDTNFFSSKTGKGLVSAILGNEYTMSDEFRQILKDNDEIIDKSLGLVGIQRGKAIVDYMEEVLEKNEKLSDREKYRYESIIRLQLGYEKIRGKVQGIVNDVEFNESTKEMSPSPLEGDTVSLKTKLDPKTKDLSNADIIRQMIVDITSELDQFRLGKVNQPAIDNLERQLEELQAEKDNIDTEALKAQAQELKDKIQEEKKKEDNEDKVSQLEEELAEVQAKLDTDVDSRIKEVQNELEETRKRKTMRIVKSPEYLRLNELHKKKAKEGLTEEERIELEELEEDIDQWMTITGIVSEGVRLSDLVEQLNVLENTPVEPYEKVTAATSEDVVQGVNMQDKTGRVHYNIAQTYDGVTAIMDSETNKIEISGITWDAFIEEAGIPIEAIELDKQGKKPIGGMITMNKQGNLLISPEDVEAINNEGRISILPTNESLTSNYSMVLKNTTDEDGNTVTTVLKSNFNQDFKETKSRKSAKRLNLLLKKSESAKGLTDKEAKELSALLNSSLTPMKPDSIYDMKEGDQISLEVSPADGYNVELLDAYDKAKKSKAKDKDKKLERALSNLREGLVIRVVNQKGDFVGVLKSRRQGGIVSEDLATKFMGLRDSVVDDIDFIDGLVNIGTKQKVTIPGEISVNNVYIGHPTFNFKKTGPDTMTIESKPLTDEQIKKIVDIGYVYQGKQDTQSGNKSAKLHFLKRAMDRSPEVKIPFVVVEKGNTRIAIPVTIEANQKEGLEEFERIYQSEMSVVDKAMALNKFMASRGIDISKPGNSFVGIENNHNITDEFFSKQLAELESIDYYRDMDSWLNSKLDKARLLKEGVSTNIDIHNPVHSPKVSLDFSKLDVTVNNTSTPNPSDTNNSTSSKVKDDFDDAIENAKNKDC